MLNHLTLAAIAHRHPGFPPSHVLPHSSLRLRNMRYGPCHKALNSFQNGGQCVRGPCPPRLLPSLFAKGAHYCHWLILSNLIAVRDESSHAEIGIELVRV